MRRRRHALKEATRAGRSDARWKAGRIDEAPAAKPRRETGSGDAEVLEG